MALCKAAKLKLPHGIPHSSLEKLFLAHHTKIESWFRREWKKTPPPLTTSVDLRNEGFKLAPVDTNLFPAGFNNLNPASLPLCIQAAQSTITERVPSCTKIMLIPENHTRNRFYFDSLLSLYDILSKAGFEVRIGSLMEDLKTSHPIESPHYPPLYLEPLIRTKNRIHAEDFDPCIILLNNDLSSGIPDILNNIEQPIFPNPKLGWSTRLKSTHFTHYQAIAQTFGELIGLEPWFISPLFNTQTEVDFMEGIAMEALAEKADKLLNEIRQKYHEFQVHQEPFIVIKADSGTYGMGIMMIKDAKELLSLNRKQRSKMAATKGHQKITHVILQEGVYTFESVGSGAKQGVAEPVIYMIGQYVVGGFYRIHTEKNKDDNLNMPGMHFESMAFKEACNNPEKNADPEKCPNRFYTYSVIARLAALAAAREAVELKESK